MNYEQFLIPDREIALKAVRALCGKALRDIDVLVEHGILPPGVDRKLLCTHWFAACGLEAASWASSAIQSPPSEYVEDLLDAAAEEDAVAAMVALGERTATARKLLEKVKRAFPNCHDRSRLTAEMLALR